MHSSDLHRIREPEKRSRKIVNDAFAMFLCNLQFPSDEDLTSLFSRKICENRLPSGEKRLYGVVIYVTAVGIFRTFPQFKRDNTLVKPIPRIPDKQYSMGDSKYLSERQANVDGVFCSVEGKNYRDYEMSLWQVFYFLSAFPDETSNVAYFITNVFSYCRSDDGASAIVVQFKGMHSDLRLTLIIFGR